MHVSCLAFCNSRRRRVFSQRRPFALRVSRAKGQPPRAVAAARGRLRRRRSSPMRPGIAFVASPCLRPRGARSGTHTLFQQPARHLLARSYVMLRAVGCASTPAAPAVRLLPRQVRRGGLRRADPPAAHLRKGKASATLCLLGTVRRVRAAPRRWPPRSSPRTWSSTSTGSTSRAARPRRTCDGSSTPPSGAGAPEWIGHALLIESDQPGGRSNAPRGGYFFSLRSSSPRRLAHRRSKLPPPRRLRPRRDVHERASDAWIHV